MSHVGAAEKLNAFLNREKLLIYAYDQDGIVTMNEGKGMEVMGLKCGEMVGKSVYHALNHQSGSTIEHLKRALRGESFVALGTFNENVVLERHFTPVRDAVGNVVEVVVVAIDVSEREKLSHEKNFLIEVSKVLAESLDYEKTVAGAARLAIGVLGDYCVIDLSDGIGKLRQVGVAHVNPQKEDRAFELQGRYNFAADSEFPTLRVLRSGKLLLVPEVTDAMHVTGARDEKELELFRALASKSCLLLPLVARGRNLGVLSLAWSETPRRYSEADLPLAEEFARRVAVAVDNGLLYQFAIDASRPVEAKGS